MAAPAGARGGAASDVALGLRARTLLAALMSAASDVHTQRDALAELRTVCAEAGSPAVGLVALLGSAGNAGHAAAAEAGLLDVVIASFGGARSAVDGTAAISSASMSYGIQTEALALARELVERCCAGASASARDARRRSEDAFVKAKSEVVQASALQCALAALRAEAEAISGGAGIVVDAAVTAAASAAAAAAAAADGAAGAAEAAHARDVTALSEHATKFAGKLAIRYARAKTGALQGAILESLGALAALFGGALEKERSKWLPGGNLVEGLVCKCVSVARAQLALLQQRASGAGSGAGARRGGTDAGSRGASSGDKYAPRVMAGALRALDLCLRRPGAASAIDERGASDLWECVTRTLQLGDDGEKTGHATTRAAVALLAHHAGTVLFAPILADAASLRPMYALLQALGKHNDQGVRGLSGPALEAFLQTLARGMLSDGAGAASAVHEELYREMVGSARGVLGPSGSAESRQSVASAVRCVGALAAPTARFFGPERAQAELQGMLAMLLPHAAAAQIRALDFAEDAIGMSCALLRAFALLAAAIETLDSSAVAAFADVLSATLVYLPDMYRKQRARFYAAVAALLQALFAAEGDRHAAVAAAVMNTLARRSIDLALLPASADSGSAAPIALVDARAVGEGEEDWWLDAESGSPGVALAAYTRGALSRPMRSDYAGLWVALASGSVPPPEAVGTRDEARHVYAGACAATSGASGHDSTSAGPDGTGHWHSTASAAVLYFCEAALDVMEALDLRYTERIGSDALLPSAGVDKDGASHDLVSGVALAASNPGDMARFLALTSLLREVVERLPYHHAAAWVPETVRRCIALAEQYPLLSGFYKLLEVASVVCRAEMSSGGGPCTASGNEIGSTSGERTVGHCMDVDGAEDGLGESVRSSDNGLGDARVMLTSYLPLVASRARRYPDLELKTSCLRCALVGVPAMVHAREAACTLIEGFSVVAEHAPLSAPVLAALERWNRVRPSTLLPNLPRIVRAMTRALGIDKAYAHSAAQDRALRFLGSIGGLVHTAVADGDGALGAPWTSPGRAGSLGCVGEVHGGAGASELFDPVERPVSMPLGSVDPYRHVGVPLDALAGNVTRLSLHAVDPAVRLAAREALHALVSFAVGAGVELIGRGSVSSRGRDGGGHGTGADFERAASERMDGFYRQVMPAVLELAASGDSASSVMFGDLSYQLVHWFTSNRDRDNPESIAILDAILDGMCHESSVPIRERSTALVEEFMRWSIKHTASEELARVNADELLRRLQLRLSDPSVLRRVGACLALRRLYGVLRSQRALLDRFLLDFFPHAMTALAMAAESSTSTSLGEGNSEHSHSAVEEAQQALHVVTELCKHHQSVFRESKAERGRLTCTADVVAWVWTHTWKTQRVVRKAAMRTFCGLLRGRAQSNGEDERAAILRWVGNNASLVKSTIDAVALSASQSAIEDLDVRGQSDADMRRVLSHVRAIQAALNWHEWALKKRVVSVAELSHGEAGAGGQCDGPGARCVRAASGAVARLCLINANDLPQEVESALAPRLRSHVVSSSPFSPHLAELLSEGVDLLMDLQRFLLALPDTRDGTLALVGDCASASVCAALAACVLSPNDVGLSAADTKGRDNAKVQTVRIVAKRAIWARAARGGGGGGGGDGMGGDGLAPAGQCALLEGIGKAMRWYLKHPIASVPGLTAAITERGTASSRALGAVELAVAGLRAMDKANVLAALCGEVFCETLPPELLRCAQAAAGASSSPLLRLAGGMFELALALDSTRRHGVFLSLLSDSDPASARLYGACKKSVDKWVAFSSESIVALLFIRAPASTVARSLLVESLAEACSMPRASLDGMTTSGSDAAPLALSLSQKLGVGQAAQLAARAAKHVRELSKNEAWLDEPGMLSHVTPWVRQRRLFLQVIDPLIKLDERSTLSESSPSHDFIVGEFTACVRAQQHNRLCCAGNATRLAGESESTNDGNEDIPAHAQAELISLQADAMALLPAFVRSAWADHGGAGSLSSPGGRGREGDRDQLMKAIRDVLTLDLPLERSAEHWRERECSPQYMRMGRLVGGLLASARAALEVGADAAVLRVLLRSPLLRDPKHVLAPAVDEAMEEWAQAVAATAAGVGGLAGASQGLPGSPGESVRGPVADALGLSKLPRAVASILEMCRSLFLDDDAAHEGDLRCVSDRLLPRIISKCDPAARAVILHAFLDRLLAAIDAAARVGPQGRTDEAERALLTAGACAWGILGELLFGLTTDAVKEHAPSFSTKVVVQKAERAMKHTPTHDSNEGAVAECSARAFAALARAFVCLNIASTSVDGLVTERLIDRLRPSGGDFQAFATAASQPSVVLSLPVEMAESNSLQRRRAHLRASWGATAVAAADTAADAPPHAWMRSSVVSQALAVSQLNTLAALPRNEGGRAAGGGRPKGSTTATISASVGAASPSALTLELTQGDGGMNAGATVSGRGIPAAVAAAGVLDERDDDDELDGHPVARALRLIVERMASRDSPEAGGGESPRPRWIASMTEVMDAPATPLHTRLLMAKAFLCAPGVVTRYSRWVFGPCARAVLSTTSAAAGAEGESASGLHLNYLVRDCLVAAVAWLEAIGTAKLLRSEPGSSEEARKLVIFACRSAWSSKCSTYRTLRDTIVLLRPLVRAWAVELGLGPDLALGHFGAAAVADERAAAEINPNGASGHSERESALHHTLAGLHVLGMLAQSGAPCAGQEADWEGVWPRLLDFVGSRRKRVRQLAAETLGVCLATLHCRVPRSGAYARLLEQTRQRYAHLLLDGGSASRRASGRASTADAFSSGSAAPTALPEGETVLAIDATAAHHCMVIDKTLEQALADRARSVHGEARLAALRALRARASFGVKGGCATTGRELLLDSLMPTLRLVLDKHDPPAQLLAVQLLSHLLPYLFDAGTSDAQRQRTERARAELLALLRLRFASHSDEACRSEYHAMLMAAAAGEGIAPLQGEVRVHLLGALTDPSHRLRTAAANWLHEHLPPEAPQRLAWLLEAAACAEVAASAPCVAATLMVQLGRDSPTWDDTSAYARKQLANATFGEGRVFQGGTDVGGAAESLPLTPMFSSLPRSMLPESAHPSEADVAGSQRARPGWVLATQARGGAGGFTQLTSASLVPMSMTLSQMPSAEYAGGRNSLLAEVSGASGVSASTLGSLAGATKRSRLAMRRPLAMSSFVPMLEGARASSLRKQRLNAERREQDARANAVPMFREYRPGELVDIQISPRDLFAPLARVAAADAEVAIVLLKPILAATRDDEGARAEWARCEVAFAAMLESSAGSPAPVALVHAAAIDCCEARQPLRIGHDALAAASTPAGLAAGAAQIIEELLITSPDTAKSNKRHRSGGVRNAERGADATASVTSLAPSPEAARPLWMCLSRLYMDLCEDESAAGCLVSGGIASMTATLRALCARAAGDPMAVRKAVEGSLKTQRTSPDKYDKAEANVWYDIDLEAMQALGDWDMLLANVQVEISDMMQEDEAGPAGDQLAQRHEGADRHADPEAAVRAQGEVRALLHPERGRLLSMYVIAASHKGGAEARALVDRWEELQGDALSREGNEAIGEVERLELHASSLAAAALQCGREAMVPHLAETARARACRRLASLHPLATRARHAALADLEALNAVEAAAAVAVRVRESLGGGGTTATLAAAAAMEARRQVSAPWPDAVWDGPHEWHAAVRARHAALQTVEKAGAITGSLSSSKSAPAGASAVAARDMSMRQMMRDATRAALDVGELRTAQAFLGSLSQLDTRIANAAANPAVASSAEDRLLLSAQWQAMEARGAPMWFLQERKKGLGWLVPRLERMAEKCEALAASRGAWNDGSPSRGRCEALRAEADCRMALASLCPNLTQKATAAPDTEVRHLQKAVRALAQAAGAGSATATAAASDEDDRGSALFDLIRATDLLLSAMDEGSRYTTEQGGARAGQDSASTASTAAELRTQLVRAVLRGTRYNASAASEWMPRALAVLARSSRARAAFAEGVSGVPPGALAPWAPQLLASLTSGTEDDARAASVALDVVARALPQTLFWPMRASRAALEGSPEAAARAAPLRAAIGEGACAALERLGAALADCGAPHIRWKGYIEAIESKLTTNTPQARTEAATLWREARVELFDWPSLTSRGHRRDSRGKGGTRALWWADKHASEFARLDKVFGKDGAGLRSSAVVQNAAKFTEYVSKARLSVAQLKQTDERDGRSLYFGTGPCRLAALSPDLAAYTRTQLEQRGGVALADAGGANPARRTRAFGDAFVHVPGLHGSPGDAVAGSAPEGVEMLGAAPHARVFGSKQLPVMVRLRGSDELEHGRIVKSGEDLRLDARVQQLLRAMNVALRRAPRTARRRLEVHCYDVTPLGSQCGLVEVVNAITVKDAVERRAKAPAAPAGGSKRRRESSASPAVLTSAGVVDWHVDAITTAHRKGKRSGVGLAQSIPASTLAYSYLAVHDTKVMTDEQARTVLLDASSMLPAHALRRALAARCRGVSEAWVALRGRYASSLAASCIGGWILGLGDRHIENIMLSSDGSVVPIDFGYCFGAGAMLLPIPELVPFRLTPQMLSPLLPQHAARAGSTLHSDCAAVLRALCAARRQLAGVAEVFVREPLLDWETEARKSARTMGDVVAGLEQAGAAAGDVAMLPAEGGAAGESRAHKYASLKVDLFNRKLQLAHPTHVLAEELRRNATLRQLEERCGNADIVGALERTLDGGPGSARGSVWRALRNAEHCRSEEECAKCLLDLASDGAVLGRMWSGWSPFV